MGFIFSQATYQFIVSVTEIQFRGDDTPLSFDEVLSRFKRRGCALLVTGEVGQDVTALATRRLLGAPFEDRKRVLVLTDSEAMGVGAHLPGGCTPNDDSIEVIRHEVTTRSATAADSIDSTAADGAGGSRAGVRVGTDLDDLRDEIDAAVDRLGGSDLGPAELRVSLNSLYPLLGEYEYSDVARFVGEVSDIVTEANGMCHCHLPTPEASETVESVATLFDARVELRRHGASAQQRWHVPTYGQQTNWVSL